jgi:hypothetical protein
VFRRIARAIGLVAVVMLALAGSLGFGVPRAAAAAITPNWMVANSAITLVNGYLGNGTLTKSAFDVATTLETGAPASGWTVRRVAKFQAYGPATTAGTFLNAIANHTIPTGTTYVAYDNENWSLTPLNEQQQPGTYMTDFVSTAHANGYKAILMPSTNLTTSMTCNVSTAASWKNYLTNCKIPALVAAAHPDVFEIQAQRFENSTATTTNCACFSWFVSQAVSAAIAVAPIGELVAGLSTNPDGLATTPQNLYTDTVNTRSVVSGIWLNAPVRGSACPSCSLTGNPEVAANYLWMLGYVGPGTQTISFTPPTGGVVGGTSTLNATGGHSGNPVVFSLDPSTAPGVCSLSGTNGTTVTYTGGGSCVVDANQAGGTNWIAAPVVSKTIPVSFLPQSITFISAPPPGAVYLGPTYTLGAVGGPSGNPVVFSSGTPAVCTVADTTVSFVGAGTCTIDADQAGNAQYAPAPTATQSFPVAQATQTVSFTSTPPSNAVAGGAPYAVAAIGGGSGNPVTFSSTTPLVCSVAGAVVSFVGAGTCTVEANQAGNVDFLAAPAVDQSFAVGQGSQTITFVAPASGGIGGSATLTATGGGSGNPVVFSVDPSSDPGVCSVSGNNGSSVSYAAEGNCVIDANQAGNNSWSPAPQVTQTITVVAGVQVITFSSAAPANASYHGPAYTVSATGGGSGNPVVFSSATAAVCSVTGATVSFVGVGTCTIDANQAGNSQYGPAPTATQTFNVGQASQTITFTSTAPSRASVGGPPYTVAASGGGSGNAVTFSSGAQSVCTVTGSVVTFTHAGRCVINANEAGNTDYLPATATQSFQVTGNQNGQ